jgi:hypothetical protein
MLSSGWIPRRRTAMGSNRASVMRKARLKRARRETARLAKKKKAAESSPGIVTQVKKAAKGVAAAVGGAVTAAVDKLRGKGT